MDLIVMEHFMEAKRRIIFPLDFQDLESALSWVELLKEYVGMFKIGLELFVKYGPKAIEEVRKKADLPIFLDLKLCDIPNTVSQAVKSAKAFDVDFITVHTLLGRHALESAVEAAQEKPKILAVTILTSLDKADLLELGFNGEYIRETEELVLRYALLASQCGCAGVVVSGKEVKRIKENLPKLLTVVPGIRLESQDTQDQLRTATPADAILSGADYLVIGRPIRLSEEPIKTCNIIIQEIERALGLLR